MSPERPSIPENQPQNPLARFIELNAGMGSPRELISYAIKDTAPWDLPEEPEELKRILNEAVDLAVSLKNNN